jgi:hypothetical protein
MPLRPDCSPDLQKNQFNPTKTPQSLIKGQNHALEGELFLFSHRDTHMGIESCCTGERGLPGLSRGLAGIAEHFTVLCGSWMCGSDRHLARRTQSLAAGRYGPLRALRRLRVT